MSHGVGVGVSGFTTSWTALWVRCVRASWTPPSSGGARWSWLATSSMRWWLEGRSYREVAAAHGVSKSWVAKVIGRFRAGGYAGIVPRSRAPGSVPSRISVELEDQIVSMRKSLAEDGLDAGAGTIHYHLGLIHDRVP